MKKALKTGLAWHFKRYSKSQKLVELEAEARKAKIGNWSMTNPVLPWEWRRNAEKRTTMPPYG
ncbi:MAG: hypothetical protein GX103_08265 [Bacteroidales bacterium]|nr:hypothetical protein [Bacteroidales bacterium]